MNLTNKSYDILKKLASPILPAIAFFLTGASQILHYDWLAIAGALVALAASTLGKICGDESEKYFADKDIVPKCDTCTIDYEEENNGTN